MAFGWFQKNKEQQRFYLLPGMGGRALRRKRRVIMIWSVAAGLVVSGIFAVLLWYMSGLHH